MDRRTNQGLPGSVGEAQTRSKAASRKETSPDAYKPMSFSALRTCSGCGKSNRIPAAHLADTGGCGACKATIPPQSEPLEVDDSSFADIVREAKVPVLVDFRAEWCGSCRMAAPEVKSPARETAGKALILKVNTEEHPQLAAQFGVQSIPNFVVLRGRRPVFQRAGWLPALKCAAGWMRQHPDPKKRCYSPNTNSGATNKPSLTPPKFSRM